MSRYDAADLRRLALTVQALGSHVASAQFSRCDMPRTPTIITGESFFLLYAQYQTAVFKIYARDTGTSLRKTGEAIEYR
jgi:hypothetical protein